MREDGIDAEIDQYEDSPSEGWPAWCERQIKSADFVLVVCTETYLRRVEGEEAPGIGHGVLWEARIIRQLLYDAGSVSAKFVPVLFSDGSSGCIPTPVKGAARFLVDNDNEYERLYRLLTAQPRVLKPMLGKLKTLPPKERKSSGSAAADASTPSPPHPDLLPRAGEGEIRDSGTRETPPEASCLSLRESRSVKGMPKVIYMGVDPRELADFAVFRDVDAPWCPEMVVIPAGSFLMGSPESEHLHPERKGPQHRVTIGYRFATGRYAVTVAEYRCFVEATGHSHDSGILVWKKKWLGLGDWDWIDDWSKSWREPGFAQTDRHPVTGVIWRDAKTYAEWLSHETGQLYRLLSEAEWEYACRAGTTTPFSFGETITTSQVNYDGTSTYAGGSKGEYRQRTMPVGSFPANPWGLHEMHGNVYEWVEDVWHDSYEDAPADGSAWFRVQKESRIFDYVVSRGGSWYSYPNWCRSASRNASDPKKRFN